MRRLLVIAISALCIGCELETGDAKPDSAWLIIGTAKRDGRIQHVTAARFASVPECAKELSRLAMSYEDGETSTMPPFCTDRRPAWWIDQPTAAAPAPPAAARPASN